MTAYYYIWGPAEIMALYSGQMFSVDGTTFLELGNPVFEQEGVTGRLGYFHHPLDEEAVAFAETVIAQQGLTGIVTISTHLPKGWRTISIF